MIKFKSARWRNFLSSGNQDTVIKLDEAATTLILGVNGSGKSTFLDVVCFVLFKKPFRKVKLEQIVNTINGGDCVGELEFDKGSHQYKIRRGLKPAVFELLIDGKPREHEAAAKKDDQTYLEEDILGVNYDTFTQVVILGNARYMPFMQLTAGARREFIEHILDIGVFSSMNEILKDRVTTLKTQLTTNGISIASIKEQIALIEGFIKKLEAEETKARAGIQEQIEQHELNIHNLHVEHVAIEKRKQESTDTISDADDVTDKWTTLQSEKQKLTTTTKLSLSAIDTEKGRIQQSIDAARKRIKFYEQTPTCSMCGQGITATHRNEIITEKNREIAELEAQLKGLDPKAIKIKKESSTAYQKIQADMDTLQLRRTEIEGVQAVISEFTTKQRELSIHRFNATQHIKKLQDDLKREPGNIQEQVDKLVMKQSKLATLEFEKKEKLELRQFYDAAAVMLKDTGIKSAIIRQYLSSINKLVNKFLFALDFFVSFSMDETFEAAFKARHRDSLQYNSFSQGEKLRIDLALLFTWREIARQKNSCAINLLILDEVIDGSMDVTGTELFIKLLHEELQGSNVFVISHKGDVILDKFQNTIRFVKDKNFSKLIQEV